MDWPIILFSLNYVQHIYSVFFSVKGVPCPFVETKGNFPATPCEQIPLVAWNKNVAITRLTAFFISRRSDLNITFWAVCAVHSILLLSWNCKTGSGLGGILACCWSPVSWLNPILSYQFCYLPLCAARVSWVNQAKACWRPKPLPIIHGEWWVLHHCLFKH